MTQVKVCGVSDPAGFDAVSDSGADWVGFVFVPASPRAVRPAQAAALARRSTNGPRYAGLFVDPTDDAVDAALQALTLDVLQIYGPAARAAAVRARFGVPVWHAVGIASRADLPGPAAGAASGIDGYLLDAKPPPAAALPGGNAMQFDWAIPHGWRAPLPWLLAGGLDLSNVARAIRLSGAPGVDVSSGVERSRGVKDPALIRAFVAAVRAVATPVPGPAGTAIADPGVPAS